MHRSIQFLLLSTLAFSPLTLALDPTNGCTQHNFTYSIQKPYDKPLQERYNFTNGVHKFWVFSDDKPLQPASPTEPRTELRVEGNDYTSGIWQFQGELYVPAGITGTCVMQIHPYGGHTVTMLRVYNGYLKHYRNEILGIDIYDRWIQINVVHDAYSQTVTHFVNRELQLQSMHVVAVGACYFKCGVYTQDDPSYYAESRWRNITIWKC